MNTSNWEVAADLVANYGIPVAPCKADKAPLTAHGFKDASRDLEQLDRWAAQFPEALIGVPTGTASRILAIDVDPEGTAWYTENEHRLACGRTHKTKRGWHLIYKMPDEDVRCSTSKLAVGIDVRGEGGYIIWWPAHDLQAVGDMEDITSVPDWLLAALRSTAVPQRPVPAPVAALGGIKEGQRNEFLSREAYRLKKQGFPVNQIIEMIRAFNKTRCSPPLADAEVVAIANGKAKIAAQTVPLAIKDFYAYMVENRYIFTPTRETWPAASVDARLPKMMGSDGPVKASKYIAQTRPVEQLTWAPGEPMVIHDRVISEGGWIDRPGCNVFNLYRAPERTGGAAADIGPWMQHIEYIYPGEIGHIINWLAHRVQRPGEKLNHALVLGGPQGIGKDTILEPVKYAVGGWNFAEVSPQAVTGRFNGWIKSVIARISEARDLGDGDRYGFYEHTKTYISAPPDVLRCDEKNLREYSVFNVMGVIITSNNKSNGIYLPADDRRHFVAWSDRVKEDFTADYWNSLWAWYYAGGRANVAAYLAGLDISGFDPKAPPAKTPAWREIVNSNRSPEDASMADALDALGNPPAVTIAMVASHASDELREFLQDRRNSRLIPHRFETANYVAMTNEAAKDGYFVIIDRPGCSGKRVPVYVKKSLSLSERAAAATSLSRGANR